MQTPFRRRCQLLLLSVFCLTFTWSAVQLTFAQETEQKATGSAGVESGPMTTPVLTSISPASVAAGSGGFTLFITGSNFVRKSKVLWDGSKRPVKFDSPYQLEATISAEDVLLLGNNSVIVSNPGAGQSSPATLTVYLPLTTNDLIYDPGRGVVWASVPSSAGGALGNSVVAIDPYTGVLGNSVWVGSEPGKMALSTDDSTLWVALMGSPAVRKVDLSTMTLTSVQLYFPGGWGGNQYASFLAASPGNASTVAVSVGGWVTIYDDGTARPNLGTSGASVLAYGDQANTLYGYGNGLSIFTIDDTGIISTQTFASGNYSNDLRYDNGRLYLTSGQVLDATNGNLLGAFGAAGPVAPDSSVGRAFVLATDQFGTPNQVSAYDIHTFNLLGAFGMGGVDSSAENSPSSFVRWGEDGLALRTSNGVYIVRSPVVHDLSQTPANISVRSSAPASATTGTPFVVQFMVKNAGPNPVSDASLVVSFSGQPIITSVTASQGTCASGPVVRCDLGALANRRTASVSVTVVPTIAGDLISTSQVESSLPDPKMGNNRASSHTSVTGATYNVTPVLLSISPQTTLAGTGSMSLTVNGLNFVQGSTVNWNGSPLPTTFTSSTQLAATIDASLIQNIGSVQITVTTGSPGGGTSGEIPFSIFNYVVLDTNDIAFDPFTRRLYASIPSTAKQVQGNSVVSIDPLSGKLGTPIPIGSEPTRLGVSDDGSYLYVVLSGSDAVRRIDLTNLTPGAQFTTVSPLFGNYAASDVSVMPGNPNAVSTCGYADGIQVWDVTDQGATARPLTRALENDVYEGSVLAWGSATDLYSNDEGLSPSTLHRFVVGATSFAETDATYLDRVDGKITYSGDHIFSDGGGVVDPSPAPPVTPELVGTLPGGGSSAVDTTINGAFFLSSNSYGVTSRVIAAAEPMRFITRGTIELDNLTGDAFDLIRWGQDGVAFRTATDFWGSGEGRVVLVRGEFVLPPSSSPNQAPIASSLSPNGVKSPGSNTWVTVSGSNFIPASVAFWNNSARTTVFVDSQHLRVAIPAADLSKPKKAKIYVSNPPPGGGDSAALTFTVN